MRLQLQKGKQQELILLAKKGISWKDLAFKLNFNSGYLANELKNERYFISDKVYQKLCSLTNVNFDKWIMKKLYDNWGRSKGGMNSRGSTIVLPNIEMNEKLAEFVGAVLGDGNINFYKKGKEIGVYHIRIAGDKVKDNEYHTYLKDICREIFKLNAKKVIRPNERFLDIYSKELVIFFIKMGIKPGNKITNQSTIPLWIFEKAEYIRACLRGLIDTDGSMFRMSQRDFNLIRINFTNHNFTLLNDTRKGFLKLGYHPSKIINQRQFYLSRQGEIRKYLKEIGSSNKKHLDRIKNFIAP
ncbi:hypothetical protein HYV49_06110 [Candidatus Pacearchaeota archaeon]|nr:hypothetical protein [Candidatus Pacearchaeota archaeon]